MDKKEQEKNEKKIRDKYSLTEQAYKTITETKNEEERFTRYCEEKALKISDKETFIKVYKREYKKLPKTYKEIPLEGWIRLVTEQAREFIKEVENIEQRKQ